MTSVRVQPGMIHNKNSNPPEQISENAAANALKTRLERGARNTSVKPGPLGPLVRRHDSG